jgi:hypothetical protein
MQRALKGEDMDAAVRAARALLDRAGYGAPKQVKLEGVTPSEPIAEWLRYLTASEFKNLQAMFEAANARMNGDPTAPVSRPAAIERGVYL